MLRSRLVSFLASVPVLVVLAAVLGGCASAPVQEMSDARQAIQAAEEAGAGDASPDRLKEARRLLHSAEVKLSNQAYNSARTDAREARRQATEALRAARGDDDEP